MQIKTNDSDLALRFKRLIATYTHVSSKENSRLQAVIDELIPAFKDARDRWAVSQRKSADDFNLFEVLEVESDEVCHSKILAWLLDRRIEHGSHAQDNLGFRLFLEELATDLRKEDDGQIAAYAKDVNYWVRREVSGHEARVDIEIASQGRFLIGIENKILSAEGDDQTSREWRDLLMRAKDLNVPESHCHGIFLTLDGSEPENPHFYPVQWSRMATVFDAFAAEAEPPEVKVFATHCARAIRKLTARECGEMEVEDATV